VAEVDVSAGRVLEFAIAFHPVPAQALRLMHHVPRPQQVHVQDCFSDPVFFSPHGSGVALLLSSLGISLETNLKHYHG
jgi:hypothetical protein